MNRLALGFYVAAAVADVAGLVLAFLDIRSRVRLLLAFRMPTRADPPTSYNVHPRATQTLAAQGPVAAEERLRDGLNELITGLAADRRTTDEVDHQLASLSGVGFRTWRLWLAFGLLLLGTILGSTANLISAAGVGTSEQDCTLSADGPISEPTTVSVEC